MNMSMEWKTLIDIFEKNDACYNFIAECVYAWLAEYGDNSDVDKKFMIDLLEFIGKGSVANG